MSVRQRRKRDKRRRHGGGRRRAKARIVAGAGLGVTAALGAGTTAHAADFTVNAGDDAGDGACDPAPDGCTLRDALDDAAANDNSPTVDQILFDSSVTGTITLNGTQLPTIDEPLYIDGPGAGTLAVSGDGASRILNVQTGFGTGVTVAGLTLSNAAAPGSGGAISSQNADLTVQESTISGNDANGIGGGVYSSGALTIESSTISGNEAGGGGGGIASQVIGSGATVDTTIESSTISGNAAVGTGADGGGISLFGKYPAVSQHGTLHLESSTISGNSATARGGGVFASGHRQNPTVTNTIVANNSAGGNGPDLSSPDGQPRDVFQVAFSLIEQPAGAPIDTTTPDSNIIGVDPQLEPLANNGGSTSTQALPETSPAVDQGSTELTGDQRGLLRPVNASLAGDSDVFGANCADIGAFELQLPDGGAGPECHSDLVPPETEITDAPAERRHKKTATFAFASSEPGSSFECKVDDGPFVPCSSPDEIQVKGKGRHSFEVRAVDAAGNADPTPAADDWKVTKRKAKKKH